VTDRVALSDCRNVGTSVTVTAVLLRKDVYPYAGGTMVKGEVLDQSGSIRFVAWNDVCELAKTMEQGSTYTLHNVRIGADRRDQTPELVLCKTTTVSGGTLDDATIPSTSMTGFADALARNRNHTCVRGIVSSLSADIGRLHVVDQRLVESAVHLCDTARSFATSIQAGQVLDVVGRFSSQRIFFVDIPPTVITSDNGLSPLFQNGTLSSMVTPVKTLIPVPVAKLGTASETHLGARAKYHCVVAASPENMGETPSGVDRMHMIVADDTCDSMHVTVFVDNDHVKNTMDSLNTGQVIVIEARTTPFRGLSLSTNKVLIDTSEHAESLQKWWASVHACDTA